MNANLAAVLYLVAGVLFILSLRGLSSPASSRQGNFFGMIGMAIAELLPESYRGAYQRSTFPECWEMLQRVMRG